MTRITLLVLAASLPFAAGCRQPAKMYQDAQVRIVDSQVCFSVSASEEAQRTPPTIAAISVSKYTENGGDTMWQWITPNKPSITLRPEDCIPYGYRGGEVVNVGATSALRTGGRYHVAINSDIPNPATRGDRWLNRMYSRDFCLVSAPDGGMDVVLVPRSAGALQWSVCESTTASGE